MYYEDNIWCRLTWIYIDLWKFSEYIEGKFAIYNKEKNKENFKYINFVEWEWNEMMKKNWMLSPTYY